MDLKSILQPKKMFAYANFILLVIFMASLFLNQIILIKTAKAMGIHMASLNNVTGLVSKSSSGNDKLDGDITQDAIKLVISSGQPAIYGAELGLSFDAVQNSMNIMRQMDPTYGQRKIVLADADLQRYIDVAIRISCEYCCGAASIIDKSGRAACGCAHSQAMRGLLAYLIKNHANEYSNDELLRELARWKGMYFPKQMIQKMASQLSGSDFTSDIASLLLDIKLPDYGQGGTKTPLPSELNNLPNMVGGC